MTSGQGDDIQNAEMAGIPVHEQAWRLTPWVEGRIEALASRLTPPQIAVALAGLQDSLAYVSAIATDMLLQSMEADEQHRHETHAEQAGAEDYEDVPVEEDGQPESPEPEAEDTMLMQNPQQGQTGSEACLEGDSVDHVALVQQQPRPRPGAQQGEEEAETKNPRPSHRRVPQAYRELAEYVEESRPEVSSTEPTLFLLANLGVEPRASCGQVNESVDMDSDFGDEHATTGQVRQGLLRWYRTLPVHRRARAVRIALALVGVSTNHEIRISQQVARDLQATEAGVEDEVVQAILQNWGDTSDVPMVEAFLRHQAKGSHRQHLMQAADALRAGRQKRSPGHTPQRGQRLLADMWSRPWAGATSSTDTSEAVYIPENILVNSVENPGTYLPRLQILRLEQTWPTLPEPMRERVLATVISQLPEADLRGQAAVIAAIYAQVDQAEAPRQLVDLRIGLRATQPHAINETEQIETQHIGSSTEEEERKQGERKQERRDAEDTEKPSQADKRPRRPSKKAPRLTQKEIAKLGSLPGRPKDDRRSQEHQRRKLPDSGEKALHLARKFPPSEARPRHPG